MPGTAAPGGGEWVEGEMEGLMASVNTYAHK